MKVCVFGMGAIGGWIAVKLADAGHEVSAVARGSTLDAIRTRGLRLVEQGLERVVKIAASPDPRDLGVHDLVVVSVKAPALQSVAMTIGPLLDSDTTILSTLNGVPWWFLESLGDAFLGKNLASVDPHRTISEALPSRQTVGCVVHASCFVKESAVIHHHKGNRLILGDVAGGRDARTRQLVDMFGIAGFESVYSPRIQRDVWFKLWGNMTMNPISALTGATTDRIVGDDLVREFVIGIMTEAKEIGARCGIDIQQSPEERLIETLKLGAATTSMLQDVKGLKRVELDAMVESVRELGLITGVPTPFIDALMGLARLHASTLGLYRT